MTTQKIDLDVLPKDEEAIAGYETILTAWKKLFAALDEGRSLSVAEVETTISSAKDAMFGRENVFFDALLDDLSSSSSDLRHAKLTAGLNKILMDRQGFKVSKEGGGLG